MPRLVPDGRCQEDGEEDRCLLPSPDKEEDFLPWPLFLRDLYKPDRDLLLL